MHMLPSVLVLTASLACQTTIVPGHARMGDGNSAALIVAFHFAYRQQILIDEPLLRGSLMNRAITGVAFRRDAAVENPYQGGEADLAVTLSISTRSALNAAEVMDRNHDPVLARRVRVFAGRVTLPASASPIGRTVGWHDPQDVVEIAFARPFVYSGGTLCIEISGQPAAGRRSRFWAVDATADGAWGRVERFGDACGPFGGRIRPDAPYATAYVSPGALVLGSSASFSAHGNAGRPAVLLLGFTRTSIDLFALGVGGPNCRLFVADGAPVWSVFEDWSSYGLPGGHARVRLRVPVDPNLLGGRFLGQFVEIDTPILTSNGLDCTIASRIPSLGMSMVTAPFEGAALPTRGRVDTTKAPVIRFRF